MVYVYQPINPLQSFAQGFEAVQGLQQRRIEQQQAQAKQQRALQMRDKLAALRANPSPQALAEFQLEFPEMAEPIKQYMGTLNDAAKQTELSAMQDVLIAERTGGDIPAIFDRYAEAAENSRDMATAKKFRDAAAFARENPEGAAQATRIRLGFMDKDAYERFYGSDVKLDTPIIKNLMAEGLQPGTEEFRRALREDRTKVSFFHPEYGFVSGSPDFVQSVFGGSAPPDTESLPRITTQEGYDALQPGQRYVGPDGKPYRKGGAGSNASGNF